MQLTIISSFIFFTGLVGLTTYFLTRNDDHQSSKGFFLGGRSLTFPLIAGSLLLTNLSTEQMIGLNGAAFRDGLSVMAWEVVAVVALVIMALFFLPKFLKSGITTVPQYLGKRFNKRTQVLTNLVFLFAYAVILLPIILYTGAKGLMGMLDLATLTGIGNETTLLWLTVWSVGLIGSIYALFGGLRTVAVSDTLNGIGLLVGGLLITYFGLNAVSDGAGMLEGWNILKTSSPENFNSMGGENQSVPFSTLFSGVLLLNLFYWCTNQQIIQRTFGAKNLAEGQKGVLLTGGLKLLGPLYLVLPGMISFYLFKDMGIAPDQAYGMLVNKVLPPYLNGFFAAVMIGAILSSFNSALNSTCTLFSLGIYNNVINPDAKEESLVKASKYFGWVMALITMTIAPLLAGQDSIFGYLQKMNGIYFIPLFAIILVGMLSKRIPAFAANWALPIGILVIAIGYFVPIGSVMENGVSKILFITDYVHDFHFLGLVFLGLVLFMMSVGLVRPTETEFEQIDEKLVDITPWKYAPLTGGVLIFTVFLIYYSFSDYKLSAIPLDLKQILIAAVLALSLIVWRIRRKANA